MITSTLGTTLPGALKYTYLYAAFGLPKTIIKASWPRDTRVFSKGLKCLPRIGNIKSNDLFKFCSGASKIGIEDIDINIQRIIKIQKIIETNKGKDRGRKSWSNFNLKVSYAILINLLFLMLHKVKSFIDAIGVF